MHRLFRETSDTSLETLSIPAQRPSSKNGRWVTGTEQNEESEFLTVRNIPNIKVSDFRDIQDLGQQLNLARTPTFEEADPSESSAYFS